MAQRAAQRLPEIRRVLLFGSLATGGATLHSDADLLVELVSSDLPSRHRIPAVLEAMAPVRVPLDLFVFTSEELRHPEGVARRALEQGINLLD